MSDESDRSPIAVLLPTHNHPTTLKMAIDSVLKQSLPDLTLYVIGDGVEDDTREVMARAVASDSRVRFVDKPKGQRHGEAYRHELLAGIRSPLIAYQGDDDLWASDHLEYLVDVLGDRDFANPLPLRITPDGLEYMPTDLARQECIEWALQPTRRNVVDLTGVVHTLSSYRRLPHGWRPAPADRWTDHYMWQQYWRLDGFTAATGERPTTVKLGEVGSDPTRREWVRLELERWWQRMHEPGFDDWYEALAADAIKRAAIDAVLSRAALADRIPSWAKRGGIRRFLDRRA